MRPTTLSTEGLECKGELLNRVLGGIGSSVDQRAFEVHITRCESCRLSHQLCGDFERIGAASDDSVRISRIAAAALERRQREAIVPFPKKQRKLAWRVTLAALAIAGSAAAAAATSPWLKGEASHKTGDPVSVPVPVLTKPSPSPSPSLMKPEAATEQADQSERSEAEVMPPHLPPATNNSARASEAQARNTQISAMQEVRATAQSLFREANQARRSGDVARAVKLYQQLQRQFATTPEAQLSFVSLGRLLLESGSSAAALSQFDRYLGSGSTKSLAAEALYGRGRALKALGRQGDEAENWQRLLSSYPKSPYSGEARARLQTLR